MSTRKRAKPQTELRLGVEKGRGEAAYGAEALFNKGVGRGHRPSLGPRSTWEEVRSHTELRLGVSEGGGEAVNSYLINS